MKLNKVDAEKYEIAVNALKAISDPISHIKSKMNEGESLNGLYVIKILDNPSYYQEIANNALRELKIEHK
jgi:hypothetical protein